MVNKHFEKSPVHFVVFLASFFLIAAATAQGGEINTPTDDEVNEIAKTLYCPVCPNTPLDVCETKACQDWREQIRMQLAQGWTEKQIVDYFVQQYGERVLAEPSRSGFSALVWVIPIIVLGVGLIFIWRLLQNWLHASPDIPRPESIEIAPDIREKIEKELRAME